MTIQIKPPPKFPSVPPHFPSAALSLGLATKSSDYIDSEIAKVKFIDATQSISELPIVKVVDTAEKLMFLEGNSDPYMTVHTIYKESGVATYEKSMSLLGIPVGTVGMGSCVDY